jgi:hypothetical protein
MPYQHKFGSLLQLLLNLKCRPLCRECPCDSFCCLNFHFASFAMSSMDYILLESSTSSTGLYRGHRNLPSSNKCRILCYVLLELKLAAAPGSVVATETCRVVKMPNIVFLLVFSAFYFTQSSQLRKHDRSCLFIVLCRFTNIITLINDFTASRTDCVVVKNVNHLLKTKTCVSSAVGSFVLGPKLLFKN